MCGVALLYEGGVGEVCPRSCALSVNPLHVLCWCWLEYPLTVAGNSPVLLECQLSAFVQWL